MNTFPHRFSPPLYFVLICLLFSSPGEAHAVVGLHGTKIHALPQFARRYNVKCSACHTIVPVLNEQGYMFKRLGYHLPPSLEKDQKMIRILDLVAKEPTWALTNNAALAVTDFGYYNNRSTQVAQPSTSTSAFQVNAWNAYFAGWVPNTSFYYYSEFDIVNAGETKPQLMNANVGYAGGNARNSWFADGGRQHLQVAMGTRAAQVYSLLPTGPALFETMSPGSFIFDQSPVGFDAGYTHASSNYKRIFAATAKITNGDNADGSEILSTSARNSKDAWVDLDFWYAPESGVSFISYYGKKDSSQLDAGGNLFTSHPQIRRQGVFANYKLFSRVDLLGGYMHSNDDYQPDPLLPRANFRGNDGYVAVDYYIMNGLAVSSRYDRLSQRITGGTGIGLRKTEEWGVAVNKTFTTSGNIVGRIAYKDSNGRDPLFGVKSTNKFFQTDIMFSF